MSDTATADAPPVFGPSGAMQGNLTSSQGQPPAPAGASPLAPQSPLANAGIGGNPAANIQQEQQALKGPMSALSAAHKATPQTPNLQQQNEPPPDAKEYQKGAMEFASAMAVLGAISGRFTRAPGGAALGAFAAALKGWQSGNLQAYENAAKKWEQQTKQTIDNNKVVLEKYKLALQDNQKNIDEQMSSIQLIAAQYHDQIMYDAAAAKNFTMVSQIYEKGVNYTGRLEQSAAGLSETRKNEETKQALVGERVASGQINPDGVNPQTGQPYSEAEKQYFKYTKEQYLAGFYGASSGAKQSKAIGGLAGQLVSKENSERAARGESPMTAAEEINFVQSIHPPRSAPAMAVEAFKKDFQAKNGRPPNGDEITKFASNYSGEQSFGRTTGSQGARVENAVNEVEQLIPQAVEASHNLPRGKFVNVNQLMQSYEKGISDPAYNDFALANFSLVNAYTRAMNPQGVPRIQERLEQHAAGILSTATSPEAYDVQVRRLWKEVQASKTATAKTAQGRSPGDINSPVPGLDDKAAATSDDGWTVKVK